MAALKSAGSAPAVERCPPCGELARAPDRVPTAHPPVRDHAAQDPRALAGDLEAPARLGRRAPFAGPAPAGVGVAHVAPAAVGEVAVLDAEAHLQRAYARLPPGIEARMPIAFGWPAVSHTLTVAHRSALGAARRARRTAAKSSDEDEGEARHRRNQHGSSVMDAAAAS